MEHLTLVFQTVSDMLLHNPFILYAWIGALALVFLSYLFRLFLGSRFTDFRYKFSGRLFSEAEHSFYLVLKQALSGDGYEIFAKVRIADILAPDHALSWRNRNSALFKIWAKHFDYVLCDKHTLAVVAVIELDDSSHNQSKTRSRDIFVENACKTAGLKLIRFPCRSNYHLESVYNKIMASLKSPN